MVLSKSIATASGPPTKIGASGRTACRSWAHSVKLRAARRHRDLGIQYLSRAYARTLHEGAVQKSVGVGRFGLEMCKRCDMLYLKLKLMSVSSISLNTGESDLRLINDRACDRMHPVRSGFSGITGIPSHVGHAVSWCSRVQKRAKSATSC